MSFPKCNWGINFIWSIQNGMLNAATWTYRVDKTKRLPSSSLVLLQSWLGFSPCFSQKRKERNSQTLSMKVKFIFNWILCFVIINTRPISCKPDIHFASDCFKALLFLQRWSVDMQKSFMKDLKWLAFTMNGVKRWLTACPKGPKLWQTLG